MKPACLYRCHIYVAGYRPSQSGGDYSPVLMKASLSSGRATRFREENDLPPAPDGFAWHHCHGAFVWKEDLHVLLSEHRHRPHQVWRCNPKGERAKPEWTLVTHLPTNRQDFTLAAWNDLLVVVGGNGFSNESLCLVEVFDAKDSKWHRVADLPIGLHGASAVARADCVYVVGGFSKRKGDCVRPQRNVYRMHLDRDALYGHPWVCTRRTVYAAPGAALVGDLLFTAGGINRHGQITHGIHFQHVESKLHEWVRVCTLDQALLAPILLSCPGTPQLVCLPEANDDGDDNGAADERSMEQVRGRRRIECVVIERVEDYRRHSEKIPFLV